MAEYGKILMIAIPGFILLILSELAYAHFIKKEPIRQIDTIASLSSGMTNILKDVTGLTIAIFSYQFFVNHLSLFEWAASPWAFVLCFVLLDLSGYWIHRLTHEVNYFWNLHLMHHSSEEYNLPCALRQQFASITNFTSIISILPCALLGIPFEVFLITAPIHLFAQFWYHTRYIDKLGFLEKIIVTPSHHRVHHAMNDLYIDKNYSQIFIIWDKLFGTFQEELKDVQPVYGIRRPVYSWNPFWINFQHLWLLMKDCYRTESWKDKFRIWFMPTGWRPPDVVEKYPVKYIREMDELQKYDPVYPKGFLAWAFSAHLFTFVLLYYFFYSLGSLPNQQILLSGIFILVFIFSYTAVMDKSMLGLAAIVGASAWGMAIIVQSGSWFGMDQLFAEAPYLILAGFILLPLTAAFFYLTAFLKEKILFVPEPQVKVLSGGG